MAIFDKFYIRLQYLIDIKKITPADLVRANVGSAPQISKWLSGSIQTPSLKTINRLIDYFGCDKNWLSTGIGEPFPSKVQKARIGYAALKEQGIDPMSFLGSLPVEKELSMEQGVENAEPEQTMIRMYRQLAEMDADTFGEIQTWINDMEKIRPGFTGWFRIEFQNRFPEFDDWKRKVLKKRESEDRQNRPMDIKTVNGE